MLKCSSMHSLILEFDQLEKELVTFTKVCFNHTESSNIGSSTLSVLLESLKQRFTSLIYHILEFYDKNKNVVYTLSDSQTLNGSDLVISLLNNLFLKLHTSMVISNSDSSVVLISILEKLTLESGIYDKIKQATLILDRK